MIDTHAHLNFKEFDKDLEEVLERSFGQGMENIIIVSSDLDSSCKSIKISERDSRLYAAVGIHPEDVDKSSEFVKLEELANNKKVKAIGETGLDYHRLEGTDTEKIKKDQIELLEKHIVLAAKISKPLILHCREAQKDFIEVLKNKEYMKGVLHCYTGDWTFAEKILDLRLLISFTGIITFTKDEKLIKVVRNIPLEKIMVETDCPFLAPPPYRGKRCEPWYVRETIKKIAEVKGLDPREVEEKTSTNAKKLFGL